MDSKQKITLILLTINYFGYLIVIQKILIVRF